MAQVFLGSLMLVPYNFAPNGWAFCQGQILPISQYTALFSLLGTYYGGNGTSNFALPDLRGAIPIGAGQGPGLQQYVLGETGGEQSVTLQATQVTAHQHTIRAADSNPSVSNPVGSLLAKAPIYTAAAAPLVNLNPAAVSPQGAQTAQPHNNLMPYLALNWIIALQGIFPSRP